MFGYQENPMHCRGYVVSCYEPGLLPPAPGSERAALARLSPEAQERVLQSLGESRGPRQPHEMLDNPPFRYGDTVTWSEEALEMEMGRPGLELRVSHSPEPGRTVVAFPSGRTQEVNNWEITLVRAGPQSNPAWDARSGLEVPGGWGGPIQPPVPVRCIGRTKSGGRCRKKATGKSKLCSSHQARKNPWFSPEAMQYVARFTNPPNPYIPAPGHGPYTGEIPEDAPGTPAEPPHSGDCRKCGQYVRARNLSSLGLCPYCMDDYIREHDPEYHDTFENPFEVTGPAASLVPFGIAWRPKRRRRSGPRPNPWFSPEAMQYVARFTMNPPRGYLSIISEATGVTDPDELEELEAIMRHEIYHPGHRLHGGGPAGVLDWQTREQLGWAAREAVKIDRGLKNNPGRACAACGMIDCDCGCDGDPARCICRDLNRNPPEVKLSKTQEAKYHHLTVTDPKGHKRLYSSYRLTPWRGSSNVLVRYGIRKAPGPRGGMTGKVAFLFPATEFTLAQAKAWVASPSHGGPHEVYKIRVSRKKPAKKKAKKRKRAAG